MVTMAHPCTRGVQFFLHTFLFVSNTSMSASASDLSQSASGNYSATDWLGESNSTRAAKSSGSLKHVVECMQVYAPPVFFALGVAGSILGSVVLLGTYLRYKFFSHFLVCLNVSSAAFLVTVCISWLNDIGVDMYIAPGLCQVYTFCAHFFIFLVVWISVTGSYLVLLDWLRPGYMPWLSSPTAAKIVVLGLSVLGFTVYSYKTWTYFTLIHKGSRVCTIIPENDSAMAILSVLDELVLLVLPSLLFIVFVFIVISRRLDPYCHCVRRQKCQTLCARGLDRVIYTCPSSVVISEQGVSIVPREAVPRLREVHRLVLCQAVCFLLLVTPRAVSGLILTIQSRLYKQSHSVDDILMNQIFQLSFFFYFAVLPFCPAFSSSKFRLHCFSLLTLRKSRPSGQPE